MVSIGLLAVVVVSGLVTLLPSSPHCLVYLLAFATPTLPQPPETPFWGHVDNAPTYEMANGKGVARLVSQGASYMGVLEGRPGLQVPAHKHSKSTEMLYVLEGGGWMTIAGKREEVRPGMVISVPAGIEHAFEVPKDAKKAFKAVQVYTPSGPEQRFKKGKKIK